jgi:hypothetical protein
VFFSDFSSLVFYYVYGKTSAKGSTSLSYFGKAVADGTIGGGILFEVVIPNAEKLDYYVF